jgi:alpha-glucosidase
MVLFQTQRSAHLSLAIVFIMVFMAIAEAAETVTVASPSGKVSACLAVDDSGRVVYNLQYGPVGVLENSPMGITVDGVDLGQGAGMGQPERATVNEKYPWRGVKSEALSHYNSIKLPVEQQGSGLKWILEARAYDDGFAYRYVVPGEGKRLVQGESSCWRLPAGSKIWYQTSTRHYEGVYITE